MAADGPRVGIAVLNYRGLDDTLRCIESLRALDVDGLDTSIVVVDNGSGDGSAEHLRTVPDIELVESTTNLGFGRGSNLAIDRLLRAGADYVWLLNNDTTVDPGALRGLVATAEGDARIGAVGSVIYDAASPARVLTWGGGSLGRYTAWTFEARGPGDRVDYLSGASLLLRLAAVADVGAFDPDYFFTWEDVELSTRLRAGGWRLAVAEGTRVWHRVAASAGPWSDLRIESHMEGAVRYQRQHSPLGRAAAVPLLGHYAQRALRARQWSIFTAARRGLARGWTAG